MPRRRPTPRSPRCASAARPATTAWPRGWSPTRSDGAGLRARAAARSLGAAPGRRRARLDDRRCASCATPTGAGWPAAAPPGWRPGPAAGRWAPAARSRSARTRSRRSSRELEEEWSVAPSAARGRGAGAPAQRLVMLVGPAPGCPRAPRPSPDARARRVRLVAGRPRGVARGGRRGAAARGDAAGVGVTSRRRAHRSRGRSPSSAWSRSFCHSAIYLSLLAVWLVPGLHGAEMRARAGATGSAGS